MVSEVSSSRFQDGRILLNWLTLAMVLAWPTVQHAQELRSKPLPQPTVATPENSPPARYKTRSLRGQVVWLNEALKRRYGIGTVPEAAQRVLALENPQGQLYPIVEDIRGRAFRKDARLRKMDVELLVRQYTGSPMVQIIRVYAHEKGQKAEVDYWCEICAIAMYELKPCDCCQGPIDLRRRPVPTPRPR